MQTELFPKFTEEQKALAETQILEQHVLVDYDVREYPVDVLVEKYWNGHKDDTSEIFIPKYQRAFVWTEKEQSKFIESIMLGLPIPYLFVADNQGRLEVVDGSQRIRTLKAFLYNELELEGLEKLTYLEGFKHRDLIHSRQMRFNRKTLRLIELTEKADIQVRKDLFDRINTTAVNLSDMEKRRGLFEGDFLDFVDDCAKNPKFLSLCPISDKRAKREEAAEMVLRFFAYSDQYQEFVHIVKDFLNDYVKQKQINFNPIEMRENFEDMLDFVEKYFPNGFRKTAGANSTPRVRFEAISVGVALALKENPKLVPLNVANWLNSKEFEDVTTTDAANNKNKLIERIEFVKIKLLKDDRSSNTF